MLTFRVSGVSTGAVSVKVNVTAILAAYGLHLTPEGVQAQFVRVLLLWFLVGRCTFVLCVFSCSLVLVAWPGPRLTVHLGGTGAPDNQIDRRKQQNIQDKRRRENNRETRDPDSTEMERQKPEEGCRKGGREGGRA